MLRNWRQYFPRLSERRTQLALAGIGLAGALAIWALVSAASGSSDPEGKAQRQVPTATTVRTSAPSATAVSEPTATPVPDPTTTPQPPPPADPAQAAAVSPNPGSPPSTEASNPAPRPRPAAPGPAPGTGLRLVIPRIGVNAPVNLRVVGADGVMHNPNGPTDVVWYDFSAFPGLGGFPGSGGNAVFAGHVDYHNYGPAVFWNVRNLAPGDIIEVYLADGGVVRYAVQWSQWISPAENFASFTAAGAEETITLVTCVGTFNYQTREYSNRLVVRGVRVP